MENEFRPEEAATWHPRTDVFRPGVDVHVAGPQDLVRAEITVSSAYVEDMWGTQAAQEYQEALAAKRQVVQTAEVVYQREQ